MVLGCQKQQTMTKQKPAEVYLLHSYSFSNVADAGNKRPRTSEGGAWK